MEIKYIDQSHLSAPRKYLSTLPPGSRRDKHLPSSHLEEVQGCIFGFQHNDHPFGRRSHIPERTVGILSLLLPALLPRCLIGRNRWWTFLEDQRFVGTLWMQVTEGINRSPLEFRLGSQSGGNYLFSPMWFPAKVEQVTLGYPTNPGHI